MPFPGGSTVLKFTAFPQFVLIMFFLILGCQGGAGSPVSTDPFQISDHIPHVSSSHQLLGYFQLEIDTESGKINPSPMRSGELHLNLTSVLNSTMGLSAAGVPSEHDPLNGIFTFDVTLKHPFATKPQFTGFDVRGILITPGTLNVGPLTYADIDETLLLNSDGYTRWWNPNEFTQSGILGYTQGTFAFSQPSALTASVNPYKYFADILSPVGSMSPVLDETLTSNMGRGVFKAGSQNTRRYRIKFPMNPGPQITYGYAIDCSWAPPSQNPPTDIPNDFPINANQPEAFYVSIDPAVNTLYYDNETGTGGGILRLEIEVHDWQGQQAGEIADQVEAVRVYIPALMPGGADGVFESQNAKCATYTADLTGLVSVTETGPIIIICRVASQGGPSYQQTGAPAPDVQVSAFNAILINIPDPECSADDNENWLEAVEMQVGGKISSQVCLPEDPSDFYQFNLDTGYEAHGEIVLYSDDEDAEVGLYTSSHDLILESPISGGVASIPVDLELLPGTYFLKVSTANPSDTVPYVLDFDAELVYAVPSIPVEVTPGSLNLNSERVYRYDDRAILVGRRQSYLYDASNPSTPDYISDLILTIQLAPDASGFCCSLGSDLYTMRYQSVNHVDFSNESSPVLTQDVIIYDEPTEVLSLAMTDTKLYVLIVTGLNTRKVYIYDIESNPSAPNYLGVFWVSAPYAGFLLVTDTIEHGTFALVSLGDSIRSYDVTDPTNVTVAANVAFSSGHEFKGWAADDNVIYLAAETDTGQGYIQVLEAMPAGIIPHPGRLLPGEPGYVTTDGEYVYVCCGEAGISTCDVSDMNNVQVLSTMQIGGDAVDVSVKDHVAWVTSDKGGVTVIDYTDPVWPEYLGATNAIQYPIGLAYHDGYLVTAEHAVHLPFQTSELNVINVSDPTNAQIEFQTWVGLKIRALDYEGDMILADQGESWMLIGMSNPPLLTEYTVTGASDIIFAIGIIRNAVYVYAYPGINVYDISDPGSPNLMKHIDTNDFIRNWYGYGNYVYGAYDKGINVYSASNLFDPSLVRTYDNSVYDYVDLDSQGQMLYALTTKEIEVISLEVPSNPEFQESETLYTGTYSNFDVSGQFAYAGSSKPVVCNIWPPDNPLNFGYVDETAPYRPSDIIVVGNMLYMNAGAYGIRIYELY